MTSIHRRLLAVLVVVAFAGSLTACGGSGKAEPSNTTPTGADTAEPAPTDPPPPPSVAPPMPPT